MKKVLYTLSIAFASALAFTSCTEEVVSPQVEYKDNGGANGSVGKF